MSQDADNTALRKKVDSLKKQVDQLMGQLDSFKVLLSDEDEEAVVEDVEVQLTGPLRAVVAVDNKQIVLSGLMSKNGMEPNVKLTDPISLVISCRGIKGLEVKCKTTINGKTVEKGFEMKSKKQTEVFEIKFSEFNLNTNKPAIT